VKRVVVIAALFVALAVPALAFGSASRGAGACGLPDGAPLWLDFAGSTVGFRAQVFGRPGVIAAVDSAGQIPPLVSAGAQTVFWQMTLPKLVGTPTAPADPAGVPAAASALFDRATAATGCQTPLIALNELLAPTAAPPLTPENAQYRADVLAVVQTLAQRGARTFLLLPSNPNTSAELADWWRQVAQFSDLVPEAYLSAPKVIAQGPILGNRTIRLRLRTAVASLTAIGVDPARIGLMLGFQSGGGYGRVGLQPLSAWLEYIKWSVLDAQQVAADTGASTLWAWGWGVFSTAGADADKPTAACVELWTRNPALCDAPSIAPPDFDQSLTEGQISSVPAAAVCSLSTGLIPSASLDRVTTLTNDRQVALNALFGRLVQRAQQPLRASDVLAAERLIIRVRFRGQRALYLNALAGRGLSLDVARGIIGDEVARARLGPSVASWTVGQETPLLDSAICRADQLPAVGDVKLAKLVPFLKITSR
jgi:hypothetical protein